ELLHLGPFHLLEDETRLGVDANVVARPETDVQHGLGPAGDPLLVAVADEDDAAVDHDVPDSEDLARRLELSDVDDVEGLVEEHLLTHLEELDLDVRLGIDA